VLEEEGVVRTALFEDAVTLKKSESGAELLLSLLKRHRSPTEWAITHGRENLRAICKADAAEERKYEEELREAAAEVPADLEEDFAENIGRYQKEALRMLVGAVFSMEKWMEQQHAWALRAIIHGDIVLDGDDPEVLDAVQYFIWMLEALTPWFKQHAHKRSERGAKPRLEVG
jgi:hypothetical protein